MKGSLKDEMLSFLKRTNYFESTATHLIRIGNFLIYIFSALLIKEWKNYSTEGG